VHPFAHARQGTQGHRIRLVLLEVPVQIRLLAKASLAYLTLEGSLLVVDIPHMALQIRGYAKGTFAVFAFVGLLARVRSQMPRQVRRSRKDFSAKLAGVAILVALRQVWRGIAPGGSCSGLVFPPRLIVLQLRMRQDRRQLRVRMRQLQLQLLCGRWPGELAFLERMPEREIRARWTTGGRRTVHLARQNPSEHIAILQGQVLGHGF